MSPAEKPPYQRPVQKPPLRILHIEDDTLLAEIVEIKLQRLAVPFQVTHAANRADFDAAMTGDAFDLVISDSQLPDFDTVEALTRVRQKFPGVPFIFLSGNRKPNAREDALAHGATDYVRKEELAQLIPAIQRVCPKA